LTGETKKKRDAELTDSEDSRSGGVEPGGGKLRGKRLGKLLRLSCKSELVLSDDEKDRFVKQQLSRRKSKRKKSFLQCCHST
jgi:hypothetical protein